MCHFAGDSSQWCMSKCHGEHWSGELWIFTLFDQRNGNKLKLNDPYSKFRTANVRFAVVGDITECSIVHMKCCIYHSHDDVIFSIDWPIIFFLLWWTNNSYSYRKYQWIDISIESNAFKTWIWMGFFFFHIESERISMTMAIVIVQ